MQNFIGIGMVIGAQIIKTENQLLSASQFNHRFCFGMTERETPDSPDLAFCRMGKNGKKDK